MNVNDMVGIKWKMGGRDVEGGLDCWGLVRLYYQDVLNIPLPRYDLYSKEETGMKECSSFMTEHILHLQFSAHTSPQKHDIIFFNVAGNPIHVGVALNKREMIHANDPVGVVIENYRSDKWNKRLAAFYRHKTL